MDLEAAAAFLHAEPATVAQRQDRELPGTRIGKGWVFLREDVLSFLRQHITADTVHLVRICQLGAGWQAFTTSELSAGKA